MTSPVDLNQPKTASKLLVLMFTDIVGSLALKTRLGGRAYSTLISRHDDAFRRIVADAEGAEINSDTGDGFLAQFVKASNAVEVALRFQHHILTQEQGATPLRVRIIATRDTGQDGQISM